MLKYLIVDSTTLIIIVAIFGSVLYMRRRRIAQAYIRGHELADTYSVTSCLLELGSMLALVLLFLILTFSLSVAMIDTSEELRSLQEFILRFHSTFVNTLALEVVPIILTCLTCVVCLVYMNCVRRGVIYKFQESRDPDEVNDASSKQMGLLKEKIESLDDQIKSMEFHDRQDVVQKLRKHRKHLRYEYDRLDFEFNLKTAPKIHLSMRGG